MMLSDIINKTCKKCGKVWGKLGFVLAQDIEPYKPSFSASEYRKRIRRGDDLPR